MNHLRAALSGVLVFAASAWAGAPIRLNTGHLDTASPSVTAARQTDLAGEGRRLHLVQFNAPIQPDWVKAMTKLGIEIVDYIPDNAYLVYAEPAALRGLRTPGPALQSLRWEGAFLAADKVHPHARPRADKRSGIRAAVAETDLFAIQLVADPETNRETLDLIASLTTEPLKRDRTVKHYRNLIARLDRAVLDIVAAQPDVISITPYVQPRKRDERQGQIVAGNLSGSVPSGPGYLAWLNSMGFSQAQFTASGFVVNVTDSGIDDGSTTPNHFGLYTLGSNSLASRVVYNRLEGSPNSGSTLQGCDGHGTINAHIIGGYNDRTESTHRDSAGYRYGLGIAPFVRVGSSVIFDPDNFTYPDYSDLISRAYRDGARFSSDSWGADNYGGYDIDAQEYDALVRDAQPPGAAVSTAGNQEMTIIFAAGNSGPASGSVGSPGTAKNVITVGAAENVHSHNIASGGSSSTGNDGCTTPDSEANSANDIASFSSRGPCEDDRRKPEIVAPGTHITGGVAQRSPAPSVTSTGAAVSCFVASGVCALPGGGTAGNEENFFPIGQQFYSTSSGTSHSTPAVAGGAALLRQYFINQGRNAPSPAMVKAFLVNAARYMTGAYANDSLWSNNQGMGGMNLGTAFDGTARILHDQRAADTFTASGQSRSTSGVVADTGKPVRVTLAWTDAPGSTAGVASKNDLDLVVTVNGQTYRGNVFSGPTSVTGGSRDSLNNMESVFLPAGTAGAIVVNVEAANINSDGVPDQGPSLDQDYALVIYNVSEVQAPVIALETIDITAESCGAGNDSIDPDETVTVAVALRNVGTANATNVIATLIESNGITLASAPQNYGLLTALGPAVTNSFTFTADVTCGESFEVRFALAAGTNDLGTVSRAYQAGATDLSSTTNANPATVVINDDAAASPYPSPITISGMGDSLDKVTVTLHGLSHTYPEDLDVLLVGPQGQNVLLMAAVGEGNDLNAVTLTFDDDAAASLPVFSAITSGAYRPTDASLGAALPSPAPSGPYGTSLAVFEGTDPNGVWSLYVQDTYPGDLGALANGWSLSLQTGEILCCASNQPPILQSIGNRSVIVSNALAFAVTAIEPFDGDPITLTASNLPPGATFAATNGAGTFTWTNAQPVGVYTTAFHAADIDGVDSETVLITVGEPPPPEIDISGYTVLQFDSSQSFTLPPGTVIAAGGYLVLGRNASQAAFESFWGIALGDDVTYVNSEGAVPQLNGAETYELLDADDNTVDGPTAIAISSGQSVQRTDPSLDAGNASAWSSGSNSGATPGSGGVFTDSGKLVINEYADAANFIYEFVELYFDSSAGAAPPPGIPPVLLTIPDQATVQGAPLTFAVTAIATDGDPVTLTASNLPAGAVFGATNAQGTFTWSNPGPIGSYTPVFHAADDDGAVSQAVTVTVYDATGGGTESFSNLNAPGGSYGAGSYVGDNGITWSYTGARKPDSDWFIDGQSLGFGDSTRGPRTLTSQVLAGGIGALSIKYQRYFTASGTRGFDVYVVRNGITNLAGAVEDANNQTPDLATFPAVNLTGEVQILLVGDGQRQFLVDTLSWTGYAPADPDSDGDGIDDDFELALFPSLDTLSNTNDYDLDGLTDFEEFLAGTSPTNEFDVLRLIDEAVGGGVSALLRWSSVSGRVYAISEAASPTGIYQVTVGGIAADPPTNTYGRPFSGEGNRFYRIELESP